MFRFIVLGLLRHGRTLHGYALMKTYKARTGVQMSTGTFYRELQNLVGDGLVRVVERTKDDDARRTPYQITARGTELFDGWLVRPPQLALGSDDELTARTMFLHEAPAATAQHMIDAWKEELWLLSKKFERDRQNELHRCATEREPFSILVLLLARRLRHIAGDVAYLDELRDALDAMPALAPPQPSATTRGAAADGGPGDDGRRQRPAADDDRRARPAADDDRRARPRSAAGARGR